MGADAGARSPLNVGRVIAESLALPGLLRERLWKGIALPFFLIVGNALLLAVSGLHGHHRARLALGALMFCCMAAMAVVIHRLVLLPAAESGANDSGRGLQRLAKAVLAMLALWACFVAVGLAAAFAALFVFGLARFTPPQAWLQIVGATAGAWFVARLCLVTPGLVVDQPDAWSRAWNVSRGNGWRLAALLMTGPWLLMLYAQLMWPNGVNRLIFVLLITTSALLAIFVLFAISLSYRELIARAPPPIHPPA